MGGLRKIEKESACRILSSLGLSHAQSDLFLSFSLCQRGPKGPVQGGSVKRSPSLALPLIILCLVSNGLTTVVSVVCKKYVP